MKKIIVICLTTIMALISLSAWADMDVSNLLNKVTLQLQSQQWVTTNTALVNVAVNAAVSDQGIANVQADVLGKLKQLSNKGDWHVMTFNRQLDQSGLESIQMMAQARLPQSELAGFRNKAKAISKPGEAFTLDSVQFTPSDDEMRQANASLRNNLYLQAKTEIDTLNKTYPDQKYYLYSMDLGSQMPMPVAAMAMGGMSLEKVYLNRAVATPVPVGNKVVQTATVVIASMPDAVAGLIKK